MDISMKNIRKLMGWCPKAEMLATQHSINPESVEANNQSRGNAAENSPVLPSGWWNKRHNRALITSSVGTLFSISWIGFRTVYFRDEIFLLGLISGIVLNPLLCIWDLRFLDKIKNSNEIVQKKNKLITIAGILGLISLLIHSSSVGWRYVLTFSLSYASGFCLTVFLYYIMLIYWERKNKKIVLICGSNTQEIYIVNAGAKL